MQDFTDKTGITKERYKHMCTAAERGSKWYKNVPKAFIIGGLICVAGQALSAMYSAFGLGEKASAAAVSITLIFISALLTEFGSRRIYISAAAAGGYRDRLVFLKISPTFYAPDSTVFIIRAAGRTWIIFFAAVSAEDNV